MVIKVATVYSYTNTIAAMQLVILIHGTICHITLQ